MDPENTTPPKAPEVSEELATIKAQMARLQGMLSAADEDKRKLEDTLKAYQGLTPEQAAELKARQSSEKLSDASSDPTKLAALLDEREAEVRAELGLTIRDLQSRLSSLDSSYKNVTIVTKVLNEHGQYVRPDMRDIIEADIAAAVHQDEAGNLVVKDANGRLRYSPIDPSRPMSPKELMDELEARRPSGFSPKSVHTGSLPQGQRISTSQASNLSTDGIDWSRIEREDKEYFESLSRAQKLRVYKQLGV